MNSALRRLAPAFAFLASVAYAAADTPALPRPLTLDGALTYAAAHNPGLLRTREQIREQEGVLVEARAARLPSVAAAGSYRRSDTDLLGSPLYESSNWTVQATATQVLYAGGGTQARVRAQRDRVAAAQLAFTAALNDTLLAVRTQFYAVLLDRELVGVQEEALFVLDAELTNARHRRAAGTGSDFDVLRAEVAVANARPALIRVRNAYRVAQDRLRATLGASATPDPATDLGVEGPLTVAHCDITLVDALAAARANRPEILQRDRLVQAADQGIASARSGYRPTVAAVAGYEWTKPSLVTSPQRSLDGWTAGVQANWAIFDSRATASRVTQARSRAGQARFAADECQLAVEVEVRQVHSSLTEADELLASSAKVVEQARESLRLAQARFSAGTATQLDVLTAQSSLTQSRSNLAQARHDYAVARAALQRAMGLPHVQ